MIIKNEKSENTHRFFYIWDWIQIALISVLFFSLMFLQVFQAEKVQNIRSKINETKRDIIEISLKISEVSVKIEQIRNSSVIDSIAIEELGMVKVNKENYILIESKDYE